jgi:hypothetical protein
MKITYHKTNASQYAAHYGTGKAPKGSIYKRNRRAYRACY